MKKEDFAEVLGEIDARYVKEAGAIKKAIAPPWVKWGAMAACLCLVVCAVAIPRLSDRSDYGTAGDLSPMVYVNDMLYRSTRGQPEITGKEDQLVYLGVISSKVGPSQYPQEDFQANDDIVGCAVYQFGEDIVVEIDGQYWSYCAVLDVDYTANDDGTYTCRGNTYKYMFEVSGVDGDAQVTYIILSNSKETSFEEVRYSLIKAEMSTEAPAFLVVGWYY